MKKILLGILIVIVVIALVAVLAVGLFLDSGIKKGIETFGPQLTKVDIKLESVSLSLLSGSGSIKGLVVGNPQGYKTTNAISVGKAALSVSPRSILSDKIVVHSIRVELPQITYELGPGGSNLKQIQANVEAAAGGSGDKSAPKSGKPGKKLQVDEIVITGGKVTLGISMLGGKLASAPLPEIHLTDLGKGPEGITAAELTKRITTEITKGSISVGEQLVREAGKAVLDVGKGTVNEATKSVKGIGDLFNKKK